MICNRVNIKILLNLNKNESILEGLFTAIIKEWQIIILFIIVG